MERKTNRKMAKRSEKIKKTLKNLISKGYDIGMVNGYNRRITVQTMIYYGFIPFMLYLGSVDNNKPFYQLLLPF